MKDEGNDHKTEHNAVAIEATRINTHRNEEKRTLTPDQKRIESDKPKDVKEDDKGEAKTKHKAKEVKATAEKEASRKSVSPKESIPKVEEMRKESNEKVKEDPKVESKKPQEETKEKAVREEKKIAEISSVLPKEVLKTKTEPAKSSPKDQEEYTYTNDSDEEGEEPSRTLQHHASAGNIFYRRYLITDHRLLILFTITNRFKLEESRSGSISATFIFLWSRSP